MKYILTLLCTLLLFIQTKSQEKKAYNLFDASGKQISYQEMMKTLKTQDVVFIGEIHNCPISLSLIHISEPTRRP